MTAQKKEKPLSPRTGEGFVMPSINAYDRGAHSF
jgi:hypothetical protein